MARLFHRVVNIRCLQFPPLAPPPTSIFLSLLTQSGFYPLCATQTVPEDSSDLDAETPVVLLLIPLDLSAALSGLPPSESFLDSAPGTHTLLASRPCLCLRRVWPSPVLFLSTGLNSRLWGVLRLRSGASGLCCSHSTPLGISSRLRLSCVRWWLPVGHLWPGLAFELQTRGPPCDISSGIQ